MKRLALAALLTLTACAPALQLAQREAASLSRVSGGIVFSNPGPDAAQDVAVLVTGTLSPLPAACKVRASGRMGCELGDVPAGVSVTLTGDVREASTTFYRAGSGARPIYLELP